MTQDDILQLIGGVLQVDVVPPDAAMGKMRGWDSFGQINVVLAIEAAAGIKLPGDAFGRMTSVPAIMEILAEQGVVTA